MKQTILIISTLLSVYLSPAQNLVTNPDAESLPRGTGWTIISQGALTCTSAPTDNVLNWTMKPNGTANYPYDHTTGVSGGTVFFSGCDTYFQGPFELQQTVDVSSNAALIDLGNELYTFDGYMQTPVSNQTDQGRFIVDFLNASNTILGTSYTSSWQSYFGGSGTSWVNYTNTRIAPAGTRKIRIRMQTQIFFNQPAINVYFDDISLTQPVILPVRLVSFTGKETDGNIHLSWTINGELLLKQFELELSTDATHFSSIATIPAGKTSYQFTDYNNSHSYDRYFYRLKMTGTDGKISYSKIVMIKTSEHEFIKLTPNPAGNSVTINSNFQKGNIAVINSSGQIVLATSLSSLTKNIDVSKFPAGLYVVRLSNAESIINKKLEIRH